MASSHRCCLQKKQDMPTANYDTAYFNSNTSRCIPVKRDRSYVPALTTVSSPMAIKAQTNTFAFGLLYYV